LSQLDFALEAEISQRHLSFLESGRAAPSRDMLLHLAERLDVPLRERNAMLLAAGFAPVFAERNLEDPAMEAARTAIEMVLKGHEPYPALAMRLALHPRGLAPRIANLEEWRAHLLDRLRRQIAVTGDGVLAGLLQELSAYPVSGKLAAIHSTAPVDHGGVFVPLKLVSDQGLLSLLSTTTIFGTPRDITLSEIAIEAFFPADAETGRILRQFAT
jgi:transcriptional regulator with XRE-family HTH domain